MSGAWDLIVRRDDLTQAEIHDVEPPDPGPCQAVLKVDRVGMTANNVTYAMVGESMRYWDFFPAPEGHGRVPLWGFADVVASDVDEVPVGARFYGYLPPSSHLLVTPDRADEKGFRDATEHRQALVGAYNIYQRTSADPSYAAEEEDLQILYRPLFITSFLLDDFIGDLDLQPEQIVYSSASSKTAYGTAFSARLRGETARLIGLTAERNVDFTRALGCYDSVVSYESLEDLNWTAKTIYADMSGNLDLRRRLHSGFGANLLHDAVVGATHLQAEPAADAGDVEGVRPRFFFAPDQISKRRKDWGPGGVEARYAKAWRSFVPKVRNWVDVRESKGPEALREAWLQTLAGTVDPRAGLVLQL